MTAIGQERRRFAIGASTFCSGERGCSGSARKRGSRCFALATAIGDRYAGADEGAMAPKHGGRSTSYRVRPTDRRRFRVLTVVDDCTRECLALVALSLSGTRVARELDRLLLSAARRGWWSATTAASSPATPS